MAAYRRVYDSRNLQADCQEPGTLRSVIEYGYFYLVTTAVYSERSEQLRGAVVEQISRRGFTGRGRLVLAVCSVPGPSECRWKHHGQLWCALSSRPLCHRAEFGHDARTSLHRRSRRLRQYATRSTFILLLGEIRHEMLF